MAGIQTVLRMLPAPLRTVLIKHRELLKFAVVGGTCFVLTTVVNYALKLTVLRNNPITALILAVLVATVVSYVLSREWSFRTRGGRERQHEAALFFLISGISVGLNSVPLAISHYLLDLRTPHVGVVTQEIADFVSSMILGTLVAMVFRWWAFKKWVFPQAGARPRVVRTATPEPDEPGRRAA
ncbi:GtrA family protein [Amycolatopsis acidicola]|uniref:GtrA family protein n=1 Tax=Amycolatopsis acidicola TaxID=2596893 RepID=A0A5N0V4J6_9PSEU|nr:GtrA family protein [Amycolatopsis acidicola]KAA9158913.1 GtrA family protein [Amycolatopsis acidicola]